MKKNFIRMNNNQKELSLGNFCRIIKELAQNKSFANQTEIFYTIFDTSDVSDSTINNYCIGYRAIGSEFREMYIKKRKKYERGENVFDDIITGLMSILDAEIYPSLNHEEILNKLKNHKNILKLNLDLYNIAKNDRTVPSEFTKKIHAQMNGKDVYGTLCEFLLYIVLEKKQPVYVSETRQERIEGLLNKTNISVSELEKFLSLQMRDGINYTHSLKTLAKEENPYACYEMGMMEYEGKMTGEPRYVKAYEYFKVAAKKEHPRANWLIAQMFYQKQLGSLTDEDKRTAYEYLKAAERFGSVAALNTLGLCYLEGLVPDETKDIKKAISYFEKAIEYDYVYAYNNLGKIYENKKEYKKAFDYYLKSALKGESWASNKVAEFYRLGKGTDKNMKEAYKYYVLSTEVPLSLLDFWTYYNLAKYFYQNGNHAAGVEKDLSKAIECYKKAISGNVYPAYEQLIYIYIDKYAETKNTYYIDEINGYLKCFANNDCYDKCIGKIKEKMQKIEKFHIEVVPYN